MSPEVEPRTVFFPDGGVWRVARKADPLSPSTISAHDAAIPGVGNRFDVPGIGIRYFSTLLQGCFAETLARFRPTTSQRIIELARWDAADHGFMEPGTVPAEWREQRSAVRVIGTDDFLFLDVDDPSTHAHLTVRLAERLHEMGVEQLDVAVVRGPDRRVTRLLAEWAYQPTEVAEGYAGIRYGSRLGDWECWAVFADVPLQIEEQRSISCSTPELVEVASRFGLRVF